MQEPVIPERPTPAEKFATENEPLALRMRLALNVLYPDIVNLPLVDSNDIADIARQNRIEVRKTIAKAATNDAVDKWLQKEQEDPRYKNHQEKVDLWKKEFVQQFRRDQNGGMINVLKNLNIGDIDFSHINDEQAQKIYDRYVARRGQTKVDVIEREERKFVLYDVNLFEKDLIQAHAEDYAALGQKLKAIQWLATKIFGAEDAKNIFDDLTKEIQLKTNRDTFVKQANEKATKNNQEISRLNWPHGQNEEEYRRLERLSNAQSITTVQVDLTHSPETPPSQPTEIVRVIQEPTSVTTWDELQQYIQDNPVISTFPEALFNPIKEEKTTKNEPFQSRSAKNVNLSVVAGLDKKEDALGIEILPDGKISIAVADGVSSCALPSLAPRESVKKSLLELRSNQSPIDVLHSVNNELQSVDYKKIAWNVRKDLAKKTGILSIYGEAVYDYITKNKFTETQLVTGKYDPNESKLQIALRGNAGVLILHANGTHEKFEGRENESLRYEPDRWYDPTLALIKDFNLEKNDVVIFYSDGLFADSPGLTIDQLKNAIASNRGKRRVDESIANFIKQSMRDKGLDDDVSAVILDHQPEEIPIKVYPTQEIDNAKEGAKNPWASLPKPAQPIKISDGIVAKDSHGKITSETAERHLLIGTTIYPLVVTNKWSDGTETTSRIRSPERPYHIPAVIYFDNDITPEQRILIQNTLNQVFQEIGVPQDMIVESQKSASEIFTRVIKNKDRSNQFDASLVLDVAERETNQLNKPHHMIIFTNKDLYMENVNFVVGAAQPDSGTLISLSRIWQSIKDPTIRDNTIKTEIAHEIGHVYGLPTSRRGQTNLDFETVPGSGAHCKSPGCSMKQGNVVPADFISITQDRLANLRDKFFCFDCQNDLQQKFKKI